MFTSKIHLTEYWKGWSRISSPCFWNNIFVIVHLLFIGSFTVQYIWKRLTRSCSRIGCRSPLIDAGTYKTPMDKLDGITIGISHRISKFCCSLLLIIHFARLILLLQLKKKGSDCKRSVSIAVEATNLISWTILLASIMKFPQKMSNKISWTIRAWLTCNFLQSSASLGFDIYSKMFQGISLELLQYADLISLSGCTFMFFLSVKGTTGIIYSSSNIAEPLLQSSTERLQENSRRPPYGNANLLQLVTFSWLNSLFDKGKRELLEPDEVPDLDMKDSAEFLSRSFENHLRNVKERHGLKTSSIYTSIFLFIRKKLAINASLAVISAGASFVGPALINNFVRFLNGERKDGYILALGFLSAKLVETVAQRQWMFGAQQLSMRLRAALISSIYKKTLLLSSLSRQSHTSGEIINHISLDVQKVTDIVIYANNIWMFPVQISLAIYILHESLGIGAFAGLVATAVLVVCNVPIVKKVRGFQPKIMEAKDVRMKATSEVLRNIKILKLQAWDLQYLHQLEDLRNTECNWLWKALRFQVLCAFVFWGAPAFISVITFGTCMLLGIPLTSGKILSALATFKMFQDLIFSLPDLLTVLAQGKVSIDRLALFLQEDEIKPDAVENIPVTEAKFVIEVVHGKFSWNPESYPALDEIQLKVSRGSKVAICGTVGSGKSSLLSCILGEIPKLGGTVRTSGTKAYVPQSPWILSGNVRENIIFGNPFDRQKYEQIIEACALKKDFELFANGDLTEIGERGINMSGGQKQRIQIARAVYQDADIYLFDDPFSAVDAHTGAKLFKECLMGLLKDKTVLYVVHQVEFLPEADLILVMQNGKIKQAGKFEDLLQEKIGFEVLVGAHSQALQLVQRAEISSRLLPIDESKIEEASTSNDSCKDQIENGKQDHYRNVSKEGRLTRDEEREKGSVGKNVYWSYLSAFRGGILIPVILTGHTLFLLLQIASNYWMAWASPPSATAESFVRIDILLLVYVLLSVGSQLCTLFRQILLGMTGILTSQKFFKRMLSCIMHAPMSFFDSTPTGRILNRASSDQSVLDYEMAGKLGWSAFNIMQILGTIAVMSQVAWSVFIVFIPVSAICIWYQRYYISTARELARLSEIQRAPILQHFAESLSGATTIRAFEQQGRFSSTNLSLVDNHSRLWFYNVAATEWLSFRLNVLSNFVFAFSLVLLVGLPKGLVNPSIGGLAVTYGLSLNSQLANAIWTLSTTENKIISVERILQYSRIPSEAPLVIESNRPPRHWPSLGRICFKNLEVRYAEHLPTILKNITCIIPGRTKIGIVGRTGSGKTTMIQALFRLVELREGTIEIDDIDICKIGLHDLRSRLGIIPQDPTLFEGTVRGNLDPMKVYPDNTLWEVLDKCQLGDLVRENSKKLDSIVTENGENWSVGQRQLFCLARALLKRSSILVLDEATASIDAATDGIIQETIRHEFKDCTVITIAHRINTVIDSDLILVLDEGRIIEYDKPSKLLEREDSSFSKLIKEYTMRSNGYNKVT